MPVPKPSSCVIHALLSLAFERWQSVQFFVVPDAAGGVREVRIEGLAAVAFRANGLLLRINPLAIRVLRTDDHRARRADHRHAGCFFTVPSMPSMKTSSRTTCGL